MHRSTSTPSLRPPTLPTTAAAAVWMPFDAVGPAVVLGQVGGDGDGDDGGGVSVGAMGDGARAVVSTDAPDAGASPRELLSDGLLAAAGVLIVLGIFFSLRNVRRRRQAGRPQGGHAGGGAAGVRTGGEAGGDGSRGGMGEDYERTRGVRRDLETLMVQIEEMARSLGGQLDNKISRAEATLDECDRKIKRLKALSREVEQRVDEAERRLVGLTAGPGGALTGPSVEGTSDAAGLQVIEPEPAAAVSPASSAPPRDASEAPAMPDAPDVAGDASTDHSVGDAAADLRERVYLMADAGHDAEHIARALDEQRGKVALILSMRPGRGG